MIVDLVGFGIVVPVLPFYADAFGADATVLGLLVMVYAAAQFVCAPIWGRLSDRVGRRKVLLFTVAGTCLALLALALASSLRDLFLARLAGGVFAANVSVASAYITDVTAEEERTRWMGMLGACFGIGFVVGPAIGGVLGAYGYAVPMFVAAGLAAFNLVYAALVLDDPPRRAGAGAEARAGSRLEVLRDATVRRLCLAYLAFSIAVTQLELVFAYFMRDRYGYDVQGVAVFLVGIAVVMGGIQGGGMRRLSERFPDRSLAICGSLLLAAGFVALPFSTGLVGLVGALLACAVGRGIAQPPLMSLASQAATETTRGLVMGTFQSSASLARVVGPVAAGLLYDRFPPGPFWLGAALLAAVAWLGLGLPATHAAAVTGSPEPAPTASL